METEKVYAMPFAKIYPMLVAKAVRKGRTQGSLTRPAASDNRCRCAFVCIAAHLSRFPAFCAGLP